jgi:hypothetical protein
MLVRMRVRMTGARNGEEWPGVGSLLDCSDEEGNALIQAGIARSAGGDEEHETGQEVDDATGRPIDSEGAAEQERVAAKEAEAQSRRSSPEGAETAATEPADEEQATTTTGTTTTESAGQRPTPRRRNPANEPG